MFRGDGRHFNHHRHGRPAESVGAMPLCMAGTGEAVRVVGIWARGGLARKLADMGMVPGAEIRLVNRQGVGPVLVDLKGSRLALGRGMAMKIMVEEV